MLMEIGKLCKLSSQIKIHEMNLILKITFVPLETMNHQSISLHLLISIG